ncbi:MAG: hypothetical protein KH230_13645 [Enterocloster asparagiformis]|nr:hypothetical protein [Enterocloster asparagiformis]
MICILGGSAAGKSTVAGILSGLKPYHKIITYTTRPPRRGEIDGIDYHFVSNDTYVKMQKDMEFAETGSYNGWNYGTALKDCTDNGVIVVTPRGFRNLKKNKNLNIISFYIDVPRRDRLIKSLETRDDIDECIRRNLSDIGQYDGLEDEVDFVIKNPNYKKTVDDIVYEILFLMD